MFLHSVLFHSVPWRHSELASVLFHTHILTHPQSRKCTLSLLHLYVLTNIYMHTHTLTHTLTRTHPLPSSKPLPITSLSSRMCLTESWSTAVSVQFSSVAQSCPTLRPHGLQHARPPCPSPTPRVHPNPCASSQWCHPTISSSVVPFSSCLQSFPASGSFLMSQLFTWGGQN